MNDRENLVKLLDTYEAAGKASHDLRAAAVRGDWEEFDRVQAHCHTIVALLRAFGPMPALPAAEARRRHEILTGILADDRAIRDILEPLSWRMGQVLRSPRRSAATAN